MSCCEHHCCCCSLVRSRSRLKIYDNRKKWLLPFVGKTEVTTKYAWWPTKCPTTGKWFWLQYINIQKVSGVKTGMIGGMVWPYLHWKVVSIERLKEQI